MGPVCSELSWEVTAFEPNKLCMFEGQSDLGRSRTAYIFESLENDTQLTVEVSAELSGICRYLKPFIRFTHKRNRRNSLGVIKTILERVQYCSLSPRLSNRRPGGIFLLGDQIHPGDSVTGRTASPADWSPVMGWPGLLRGICTPKLLVIRFKALLALIAAAWHADVLSQHIQFSALPLLRGDRCKPWLTVWENPLHV